MTQRSIEVGAFSGFETGGAWMTSLLSISDSTLGDKAGIVVKVVAN
jgi:hypothetical protein